MSITKVAFIMYPVTDMERAKAFYGETLGLRKGELASDAWVEFEVDGVTFGIGNFPQVGVPGTASALALEVADLPAFRTAMAAKGVAVSEAHESPICFIAGMEDPDGNKIVVHQAKH